MIQFINNLWNNSINLCVLNKRFGVFILFLLSFTTISADNVEWDSVEGAISYQFQLIDSKGKIVQENKDLKETKISLNEFPIGNYKYKIGVVDKNGNIVYGNWVNLEINDNTYKNDGERYPVHLEWEEIPQAQYYYVQILTLNEKLVKAFKTKQTTKDLMLTVGKYKYKIAIEKNGKKIWSEWKEFEVIAPEKPFFSDRANVLWRSIIYPGWGQLYRKDPKWRGWIYSSVIIPLSVAYGNYYNINKNAKNDYDNNVKNIFLLKLDTNNYTSSLTFYSHFQANSLKNEINSSDSKARSISVAIAAVYIINLIDAYFFYNYDIPISDRFKTEGLSLHFHNTYDISSGKNDSFYNFIYQLSF